MQTFLPSPSFEETARILDYQRLGKQRVEALQIINVLTGLRTGYARHPAVTQWRGYTDALKLYHNTMVREWIQRGYNNTMQLYEVGQDVEMPYWLGYSPLHTSHQCRLLQKHHAYYIKYGWDVPSCWLSVDYYWAPPLEDLLSGVFRSKADVDLLDWYLARKTVDLGALYDNSLDQPSERAYAR